MNKKRLFTLMFLISFLSFSAFTQVENYDNDDLILNKILVSTTGVSKPTQYDDFIVFTADKNARYVGIAFDFENYTQIHSFELRNIYDEDYEVSDSYYFYVQKLPKDIQQFNYRMVIDGLWTTDPTNDSKNYDSSTGVVLSHFDASRTIPVITKDDSQGLVRFIYKGKSGEKIRLGGNFTNWDSWIYEMQEVSPGLYQIDLPLPPGTYDYAFYSGMNSMVDSSNPVRVYTADGKEASRIQVN